ncbi:MAG: hypothetical protein IGQ88_03095 [Gloeomargaritaceae cyanobacterium C42_A2020_066]|nr:hypothetical protein [Gloeomargaritaceae cyanobacterium C42_A2020_066]
MEFPRPVWLKALVKSILPPRYQRRFQRRPAAPVTRLDVVKLPVQNQVYLEVYWKAVGLGTGPSLIFNAYGQEALRFDCLGPGGHGHITLVQPDGPAQDRIFLPEKTIEAQIERALFELDTNLVYWLQRNPDARLRRLRVDRDALQKNLVTARDLMRTYAERAIQATLVSQS